MVGTRFRANTNFYNKRREQQASLGRRKIAENTTISVVDTEIRNGIRWCKLDHSIGWLGGNNKIWNKLDLM